MSETTNRLDAVCFKLDVLHHEIVEMRKAMATAPEPMIPARDEYDATISAIVVLPPEIEEHAVKCFTAGPDCWDFKRIDERGPKLLAYLCDAVRARIAARKAKEGT